jgi:hypothetical protein
MSLATVFGTDGITVRGLAPGWFKTAQNRVMCEGDEVAAPDCGDERQRPSCARASSRQRW